MASVLIVSVRSRACGCARWPMRLGSAAVFCTLHSAVADSFCSASCLACTCPLEAYPGMHCLASPAASWAIWLVEQCDAAAAESVRAKCAMHPNL